MSTRRAVGISQFVGRPKISSRFLGSELRNGRLSLFVGAGISKSLGLPLWWELVQRCCDAAGVPAKLDAAARNEDLRLLMDAVEKRLGGGQPYRDAVKAALYDGLKYERDVVTRKLLVALGALMLGSRRGSVRNVISYNFDDVLEWYLQLNGFVAQVVVTMPQLLSSADVTIFHPHGFLPNRLKAESDFLIFSEKSYDERSADTINRWTALERAVLESNFGLFVGLSGDDPRTGPLLVSVKGIAASRVAGWWLLGPNDTRSDDFFIDRNVVPVRFLTYDAYADFILDIAQMAASRIRV